MEIRAKDILCSVTDMGLNEIHYQEYQLSTKLNSTNIFAQVHSSYNQFLSQFAIDPGGILGVSLALAGAVDPARLLWMNPPRIKGISRIDFNGLYRQFPDFAPLFIEHDIHAQAASVLHSKRWEKENSVFIHVGRGIAISVNFDGILPGHRGFAGEIGQIPYPCNKYGAIFPDRGTNNLETYISTKGILRFIEKQYGKKISGIEDIDKTITSDPAMHAFIADPLVFLCIIVANLFDPKTIIIGGPALEPFYDFVMSLKV